MSRLAEIHVRLALKTGDFLLSALDAAVDASELAVADLRGLSAPEQERMRDGFRATAAVVDIVKLETRRERRGLDPFFPADLVADMKEAAELLAKQTQLLEMQRDQFVLDFYRQLEERIQKRLADKKPTDKKRKSGKPEINEDGEHQFEFTGDPTPERGYRALKRIDGSIHQISTKVRQSLEQHKSAAKAKPAAPLQPNAKPAADQPAKQPADKPAERPLDALWSDPEVAQDLLQFWKAAGAWYKAGKQGPPPLPTENLLNKLERNPQANPETAKLLAWVHAQAPPDG